MANSILHKADTRGHADHGWLQSYQSFSFAGYYNPERMSFGVLRVSNDDIVDGGKGFGTHPHDNMEIISIPLEGDLEHKDNMGNTEVIRQGDVQVMSTGSGVFHSEYNKNKDRQAKFLQIWLFPNRLNVRPRYDQVTLDLTKRQNTLQQVISPDPKGEGTWIYQDAWFNMGRFDKGKEVTYTLRKPGNGIYLFVIEGAFTVDGQRLDRRDGLGLTELKEATITALDNNSELLIMEVPMEIAE
jgi:redox-sensitive bicupin YhaK (pirin superfamily)